MAALAKVGSVADVAAVAQLMTTDLNSGVLVTGLLSIIAGFLVLNRLAGRPIGPRAILTALLIAAGFDTSGAPSHKETSW